MFIRGEYGGEIARRQLLELCDVHTLLRLPLDILPGIGVRASVLFFDKKPFDSRRPWTKKLWVYDMRSRRELRDGDRGDRGTPVSLQDFKDFITCYSSHNLDARVESQNFRSCTYEELIERDDVNLDLAR